MRHPCRQGRTGFLYLLNTLKFISGFGVLGNSEPSALKCGIKHSMAGQVAGPRSSCGKYDQGRKSPDPQRETGASKIPAAC